MWLGEVVKETYFTISRKNQLSNVGNYFLYRNDIKSIKYTHVYVLFGSTSCRWYMKPHGKNNRVPIT